MPAKTPSSVIVNRCLPERLRHDGIERARLQNRQPVVDLVQGRTHNPRRRLRFGRTTHDHVEKRRAALRPRPIKFHVVRFGQLLGADVADHANHFRRKPVTVVGAEKNLMADRIFVRKKFFAVELLRITTSRESTLSCSVKSRPERSEIPSVRKYPGETLRVSPSCRWLTGTGFPSARA